jgi:hypothetical protein
LRQPRSSAPLPSPTIQPSHLRPATRHDDQLSELFGPVKGFAVTSFEAGFDAAIESRVVGATSTTRRHSMQRRTALASRWQIACSAKSHSRHKPPRSEGDHGTPVTPPAKESSTASSRGTATRPPALQEKGPRAGAGGPSLGRKRPMLGIRYVASDAEKCCVEIAATG